MPQRRATSVLVTVMFTDIVGSTEIAAELGDRRWRQLLSRHHATVRRELKRSGGRELDTAGDGFFARFDRPADAIRCACAISDAVRELGVEIRAGLHVGEAEVMEGKVGGMAVNVAARIMGAGKAGEVLVSSTLRDAVAGSDFEFADHGVHRLKGIDGEWRLHEVMTVDGGRRAPPLSPGEARTRRGFVELVPVGRKRDRILAGAIGGFVVALVAAGALTGAFGGEREPRPGGSVELSERRGAAARCDRIGRLHLRAVHAHVQPIRIRRGPPGQVRRLRGRRRRRRQLLRPRSERAPRVRRARLGPGRGGVLRGGAGHGAQHGVVGDRVERPGATAPGSGRP